MCICAFCANYEASMIKPMTRMTANRRQWLWLWPQHRKITFDGQFMITQAIRHNSKWVNNSLIGQKLVKPWHWLNSWTLFAFSIYTVSTLWRMPVKESEHVTCHPPMMCSEIHVRAPTRCWMLNSHALVSMAWNGSNSAVPVCSKDFRGFWALAQAWSKPDTLSQITVFLSFLYFCKFMLLWICNLTI